MEYSTLREHNQHLEEKSRKQENELMVLHEKLSVVEKELKKSTQTLNKSKKAKEFEMLLNENESMQRKLQIQEEEFQLQSETLMTELSELVKTNEKMDRENKMLRKSAEDQKINSNNYTSVQDEVRRLQAQNVALQNSLLAYQQGHSDRSAQVQSTLPCLKSENNQKTETDSCDNSSRDCIESKDKGTRESEGNGNLPHDEQSTDQSMNDNLYTNRNGLSNAAIADDSKKIINDLRLNLETEKEEKLLLKDQLQSIELKCKEETDGLRSEFERMSEKLKKKQESLLQLQDDKDRLYRELSQKLEAMKSERDAEVDGLHKQRSQLEQELAVAKKLAEERAEHFRSRVAKLESDLMSLQQQLDRCGKENGQRLLEQTDQHEQHCRKLEERILQHGSTIDDLKTQLKENHDAHTRTMEQLLAIQVDKDNKILELQELSRVAEKRKALLDELAIKYQQDTDHHKELVKSMSTQNTDRIKKLTDEVDQLNEKVAEFDGMNIELEKMKSDQQQLEGARSWLERRLKETEETLEKTKDHYDVLIQSREVDHEDAMKKILQEHSRSAEALQSEMDVLKAENRNCVEMVNQLRQEIKDEIEDKKLHEKKGATALKELKRQLVTERKRADKLQEKLQSTMSDSNYSRQSMEELFRPICEKTSGDSSSISSLSPSGMSRDNILSQSPDEECSFTNLQLENDELLKRLAAVQQMNWILEEKVSHLESSNAAMADDLIHKTALIEHFSIDNRSGVRSVPLPSQEKSTPLKRVVDFVMDKGNGEESTKDLNRRLQNVVEETLTKNMFLQQNLEAISQELDELRKHQSLSSKSLPPITSYD